MLFFENGRAKEGLYHRLLIWNVDPSYIEDKRLMMAVHIRSGYFTNNSILNTIWKKQIRSERIAKMRHNKTQSLYFHSGHTMTYEEI